MKPSPSKSTKAARKKRGRDEAAAVATGAAPPMSPPWLDPSREWKNSKVKTEDLLALLNSGFIREKEVDMWRAAAGDPYPMEKAEDEIPMFARFAECGLALPASDFFKGLLGYYGVEYLISTLTVFSIPQSLSIFVKHSWGSNRTGSCSGHSSR
jgi:hypothetical protein